MSERLCAGCGIIITKAEGGDVFTNCNSCLAQIYHLNEKPKGIPGDPFINKKIKAFRKDGLSLRAIASRVGVSLFTVCRRLKMMGM